MEILEALTTVLALIGITYGPGSDLSSVRNSQLATPPGMRTSEGADQHAQQQACDRHR